MMGSSHSSGLCVRFGPTSGLVVCALQEISPGWVEKKVLVGKYRSLRGDPELPPWLQILSTNRLCHAGDLLDYELKDLVLLGLPIQFCRALLVRAEKEKRTFDEAATLAEEEPVVTLPEADTDANALSGDGASAETEGQFTEVQFEAAAVVGEDSQVLPEVESEDTLGATAEEDTTVEAMGEAESSAEHGHIAAIESESAVPVCVQ